MASVSSVIRSRLVGDSAITAVVGSNVLNEFRDDLVPSLVYETSVEEVNETYGGSGVVHYELSITAVSDSAAKATELAALVKTRLEFANWVESPYTVLGVFLRDETPDSLERGSKRADRLAIVELRFELVIKTTS